MLADRVRMCSGRKKKEVILKGNKPIGWCRLRSNSTVSNRGHNELNIYNSIPYALLCFDPDTFPLVDQIGTVRLSVHARKYSDSYDYGMRVYRYQDSIPLWDNSSSNSFDTDYIFTEQSGIFVFDSTSYTWDVANITDIVKEMINNNENTLVLRVDNVSVNSDFYIDFSNGNGPYIDFTLR
ncbi:hypothetical protein ACTNDY_06775 [Tissierellaceae bacterium HCP3S3_D8]